MPYLHMPSRRRAAPAGGAGKMTAARPDASRRQEIAGHGRRERTRGAHATVTGPTRARSCADRHRRADASPALRDPRMTLAGLRLRPLPPLARGCLALLAGLALLCWLGPWLAPFDPHAPDWNALSVAVSA